MLRGRWLGIYPFLIVAASVLPAAKAASPQPGRIVLRDVAEASGLRFRFDNGSRGRHDLPEIMGGGVGLIDADGDGWLDVYFCNGGPIDPRLQQNDPPCRLFRNNRDGTFTDITPTANAPGPSYAMGAAVGDFDGDGRDDLLVTGWRDQRLYRNLGGGKFEDVTEIAGLKSHLWSTSAAFADLDGDGDLDLYVANYVDYGAKHPTFCAAPDGKPDYCGPAEFAAQADRLYRNNGDGTFTDVSQEAGILLPEGRGLGVLIADLVGDSRPDIYVANDGTPAWLFENRGNLRFREVAQAAGVALDGQGNAMAGMGVALGDLDRDASPELLVSNFFDRTTVAFQPRGHGVFLDASAPLGLAAATRNVLGFGLAVVDLDGDGWPDLIQANGHVLDRERLGEPLAMRPTLLGNDRGKLHDVSATAGPWFSQRRLGRGLAVGDLNCDGKPDVVVSALDAPGSLLRNESTGRFATIELRGRPRSAIGARVLVTLDGRTERHDVVGGGSYLSASERKIFVGLGQARQVDRIEVVWPSGRREAWGATAADRIVIEERTGTPLSPAPAPR